MSKLNDVRTMMVRNPKIKARYISKRLSIPISYVYVLMSKVRKELLAKQEADPVEKAKKVIEDMLVMPPMPEVRDSIEIIEPPADPVNHPEHYKVGGIETIDFIEAKKLNYNLGNVVKYITRADHKGNRMQDLEKAAWYLAREINSL